MHTVAAETPALRSVTRLVIDRMAQQPARARRGGQARRAHRREREVLELIARALEPRDRRGALRRGVHGQDAREADPDEARPPRPRPDRDLRLRDGRQPTRSPLNEASWPRLRHIATGTTFTVTHTAGRHRHLRLGLRESEPVWIAPPRAVVAGTRTTTTTRSLARAWPLSRSRRPLHRSLARGVKAVALSLAILGLTAVAQLAILLVSNSGRAARRPGPQLRRCAHRRPARHCVLPPQPPRRSSPVLRSYSRSSSRPAWRCTRPSSASSTRRI